MMVIEPRSIHTINHGLLEDARIALLEAQFFGLVQRRHIAKVEVLSQCLDGEATQIWARWQIVDHDIIGAYVDFPAV